MMIIECINCNKKFEVNSELIPSSGRTIQCGSCDHIWFFDPSKIIPDKKEKPKIDKRVISPKLSSTKNKPFTKIDKKNNISNFNIEKNYEITKYENKKVFSLSKFLSYILVLIISFIALLIIVDTFSSTLYQIFPDLEFIIFSLFETLKDIELFIKDLI